MDFVKITGEFNYATRGKPTRLAPRPNPAPCLAVTPMDGDTKSRTAKTAAATRASVVISSRGKLLRGMKIAAPATTRPSIKYLIARLITSETSMVPIFRTEKISSVGAVNSSKESLLPPVECPPKRRNPI